MTAYSAWWIAGGLVGMMSGLLVLRFRGALTWRALPVYAAAIVGCVYGAKIQYRLRFYAPLEAVMVAPSELLSPGLHIPLGLIGGFLAAMLVCRLLRVPLLEMGDALAMTGAAMMPVGRIGCLVARCCAGVACPTWLSPICVRTTYAGPIGGSSPELAHASLVHSLPSYFALLGLATVALHVWLLHRRVPPGTLLAVGFLVYPLGHLAIEQLRMGSSDRASVMQTVLLTTLVVDAIIVLCWRVSRRVTAGRAGQLAGPRAAAGTSA